MSLWWWLTMTWATAGPSGLVAGAAWFGFRRFRSRRLRPTQPGEVTDLAALVAIGISAGHTVVGALELAAGELGGRVNEDVVALLRRSRVTGLAAALADTGGPLGELTGHLARAQVTGAPAAAAVEAFLHTRRSDERARVMQRARTLPVRLIIPVALLLLPGFVALVIGPLVIEQLDGLFDGAFGS